ncbi:hypothetical protein [Hydrogenimonas thermophila]|uniref:Uncharacterized protein n=1 Tax=Hydrogenimonas thermophila TaxID=223786 RepID=A0A1I5LZF9_9BACT|nr:hypothetical protein [Hydrogenimonas thermophila]SFP02146.1 hypothetical protein SAMN05216234_10473 [Hydrogenimonas thermophila]
MKKMLFVSGVVAILLNGCAVVNDIPSPKELYTKAFYADKIDPTDIKAYDESHYKQDVLFAMPNAHTYQEALQQYKQLLSSARPIFNRRSAVLAKKLNTRYRSVGGMSCEYFKTWINYDKGLPVFVMKHELGQNVECVPVNYRSDSGYNRLDPKQQMGFLFIDPSKKTIYSDRNAVFVKFKPKKIGDTYYLVLDDTNIKNRSILSEATMVVASGGDVIMNGQFFMDNDELMELVNLSFFDALRQNEKHAENFVNIQTGNDLNYVDSRSEYYRQKYLESLKNK